MYIFKYDIQIDKEYAAIFDIIVTLSKWRPVYMVWSISYQEYDSNIEKRDLSSGWF